MSAALDRSQLVTAIHSAEPWIAATCLGVALLSTVTVQVPLHARLAEGHDTQVAQRLITSNWVRTVAWAARGLVLAWVLVG